jgi:hypothetical protein
MSMFLRVGKEACGNQFMPAKLGKCVPKTALSGFVVVDKSEQIRRIARQESMLPVANDSLARSWRKRAQ